MRSAVTRDAPSGTILGPEERVSPEAALALFLPHFSRSVGSGEPVAPEIELGAPADLCLLDVPWRRARLDLSSQHVRATVVDGRVVYRAERDI